VWANIGGNQVSQEQKAEATPHSNKPMAESTTQTILSNTRKSGCPNQTLTGLGSKALPSGEGQRRRKGGWMPWFVGTSEWKQKNMTAYSCHKTQTPRFTQLCNEKGARDHHSYRTGTSHTQFKPRKGKMSISLSTLHIKKLPRKKNLSF